MNDTYQPPWDHNLPKNSKLEIQIPNRHWKKKTKKILIMQKNKHNCKEIGKQKCETIKLQIEL
jgi:hypothetical protein